MSIPATGAPSDFQSDTASNSDAETDSTQLTNYASTQEGHDPKRQKAPFKFWDAKKSSAKSSMCTSKAISELQTQVSGLQRQLSGLQKQFSDLSSRYESQKALSSSAFGSSASKSAKPKKKSQSRCSSDQVSKPPMSRRGSSRYDRSGPSASGVSQSGVSREKPKKKATKRAKALSQIGAESGLTSHF